MARLDPCVIGLSGPIASGKTTISQALAQSLGWSTASFGDFVRTVARSRNLDSNSRQILQEVGLSLIGEGWPQFCDAVLTRSSWTSGLPLIVDGVRHVEAVRYLKARVAPLRFVLVYVTIEGLPKRQRVEEQLYSSAIELLNHPVEAEIPQLVDIADMVLDGTLPVELNVATIVDMLSL